ncbi:MAG: integrase/recombinase XerD [Solirubrobacteraceae bacterium]|nr:integrase/recombinase XerD [Solirubrobacteraceae bacterium]
MLHQPSPTGPDDVVARDVDVDVGKLAVIVAAPALPAAAVDRLPRGELGVPELDDDPFWRLASAFLVECRRAQTRRAYFTDLKAWYAWCTDRGLHPLGARRHDVAMWARQLAEQPQLATGKVQAPASIARRLSCLSSFYGYGVEVAVLEENPVANVKRPRVASDSMTVGLARDELEALLRAAEADGPRSAALITLLAYNGLRVDEALSRDVEHLGHQQGHRVLRISRKGGRDALEPLSVPVERALDAYLGDRASGALFVDDRGRRMYEAQAWRLVRRLARRAGLNAAGQLSPHSLRHTFATSLDDAGVPLQDIQDAMGHADPRTTRRYMATHQHLDRHATYAFAAWLRRAPDPQPPGVI